MPTLDVRWLLPDGSGGGPIEGGTARVPGALPGDRVRYAEVHRRGRTVHGVLDAVEIPSPSRCDPSCPWHVPCGGCDLAALEPNARRQALAMVVQRAFRWAEPPEVVPSPRQVGHRARVKLAIEGGRVGYRGARSHDLAEIGDCLIARPEVRDAMARLRDWANPETTEALASVEVRSDGARAVFAFHAARRGVQMEP
ncbi:MAG: hypothetical protein JRJ84_11240, partial [Deltaproteobacteria bacterium]|nr:hypothetical protein [Deltaproteobacteria bacterium]